MQIYCFDDLATVPGSTLRLLLLLIPHTLLHEYCSKNGLMYLKRVCVLLSGFIGKLKRRPATINGSVHLSFYMQRYTHTHTPTRTSN